MVNFSEDSEKELTWGQDMVGSLGEAVVKHIDSSIR